MIKEHKETVAYLIMVVVIFIVGIILGFYIWGVERGEKPDYKACLMKAVEYLAAVETENQSLKKEVVLLAGKVKDGPDKLNEQIKNLQLQVAAVTKEKAVLQSSLDKKKKAADERKNILAQSQKLTEELAELKDKNVSLQSALTQSQDLLKEKEQVQSKLQEITKEAEMLREENKRFLATIGEQKGLIEKGESLEAKNQELLVRVEESAKRIVDLEDETRQLLEENKNWKDEMDNLKARLEAVLKLVAPGAIAPLSGDPVEDKQK